MTETLLLHVDILRGRNYPQTEDDPCPCSTLVRILLYNDTFQEKLGEPFTSELQENSNAPFYSASVDFSVASGLDSLMLVVEIVETTRRMEPYVLFYGLQRITLSSKGKREEIIPLTSKNPVEFPEEASLEAMQAVENDDAQCPFLSIRYHIQRPKGVEEEIIDLHADVTLPSNPDFTGASCIIPKDSQYVWVNITSDTRWTEAFRSALVHEWRDRQPLLIDIISNESPPRGGATSKNNMRASISGQIQDIRSIGDVITKRWCCRRSHEVLTRLRLCAEAFNRGEKSLYFTRERELSFRLQRKERIYLLQEITRSALDKIGQSTLRDSMDHLWIFFSTGINHDPSGPRVLTYEARKKVREASFDEDDKAVLQSSLLNFLVPSLSLEQCNEIVTDDATGVAPETKTQITKPTNNNNNNNNNGMPADPPGVTSTSAAEISFAMALIDSIGAMLDTLTETELVAALRAFEPAVVSAHQRIRTGAKEEVKKARVKVAARQPQQRRPYKPGSGIKIEHLDILGRRKKSFHPR